MIRILIEKPIFRLLRPAQWTKNLFCLAAPIFVAQSLTPADWVNVALTFAGFCALASAVYTINDLCNLREDRAHPVKRLRPLATGAVRRETALVLTIGLVVTGALILALTTPMTLLMGGAYVGLHLAYSLGIRNIPVLELFFLATGFALRVMAGAFAVEIAWTAPLLLTTYGLSLLLGVGKRQSEMQWGKSVNRISRPVLDHYGERTLSGLAMTAGVFTALSYCWLASQYLSSVHTAASSLLVVLGIGRYLWILLKQGGGERPERLLYSDLFLTAILISWCGVFLHAIYG